MVAEALSQMLAVQEITVPVTLGASSTRGILDSAGQLVPLAGSEVRQVGTVLYVQKDTLPGLDDGVTLTVGELGAASAAGGKSYLAHDPSPIDDGLIIAVRLGGGR
jgi:hypothetical protein